jgi:hypothetical protein
VKITKTWLKERGACEDQLELFDKLYPDGVELTRAALIEAANAGLHVDWLEDQLDIKSILRNEYEHQKILLWTEYWRQIAPLWAEYERERTPLWRSALSTGSWAEYERQKEPLQNEYERLIAPILAEYECQRALLLADALELSK